MGTRIQITDFENLPSGFTLTGAGYNKVLHFQTDGLPVPFVADDILLTQRFNPGGSTIIKEQAIEVDEITNNNQVDFTKLTQNGVDVAPGDVFVRVANPAGANLMKFNVNGTYTPYIAMMQNLQSLADYSDPSKEIVRLGELGGITSPVWGALSGAGLFVKNGYFEGVYVSGTFKTALSGKRLELDSATNEMTFFDSSGAVLRIGSSVYGGNSGLALESGSRLYMKQGTLTVFDDSTFGAAIMQGAYALNFILRPATKTTATAVNNTVFIDSADNKLKFKDAGGTSHSLY